HASVFGRANGCTTAAAAKNDAAGPHHSPFLHRGPDLLVGPFLGTRDRALLAQVPSVAPARGETSIAQTIHSRLPRESATRSQRSPSGRRARQHSARRPLSFPPLGRTGRGPHPAVARDHGHLRH